MSYTYKSLKHKIEKAGEGESNNTPEQLANMLYDRYQAGKISAKEYDELNMLLSLYF